MNVDDWRLEDRHSLETYGDEWSRIRETELDSVQAGRSSNRDVPYMGDPRLRRNGYHTTVSPQAFRPLFGFVEFRILLNASIVLLTLPFAMSAPTTGPQAESQPPQQPRKSSGHLRKAFTALFRHFRHAGVGVVCAVAYFDP